MSNHLLITLRWNQARLVTHVEMGWQKNIFIENATRFRAAVCILFLFVSLSSSYRMIVGVDSAMVAAPFDNFVGLRLGKREVEVKEKSPLNTKRESLH